MEVKIVTMPTFVNPHLFWITEFNNNERSKTLNKISKQMQDNFNSATLNDSFEIGEVSINKSLNMFVYIYIFRLLQFY